MFDSHCHLQEARLLADLDGVLGRARAVGVQGFLLAGVEPAGWRVQEDLARAHPEVVVAYGVHPQRWAELTEADAAVELELLAARLSDAKRPRPVAVGEIGLDGQGSRRPSLKAQEGGFREQLALARAAELPVVLHVLAAHGRALELLRQDGLPRPGGILHSCSAPAELIPAYVALGLYVSFAGPVTNPGAAKVHGAARAVPEDRLLVETDAPFQTPLSRRPAPCEPAFLVEIVAALAQIRGTSPAEVAARTSDNARRLLALG